MLSTDTLLCPVVCFALSFVCGNFVGVTCGDEGVDSVAEAVGI